MGDNQGSIEMRRAALSKEMKTQNGTLTQFLVWRRGQKLSITWGHLLVPKVFGQRLCPKVSCFLSIVEDPRCEKYSIGEGFQLCQFWTSVVTYALRSWLPGISLLDLLLTVPDKVLHSEVQDRFSLMSLPIDKISWLKIIERLPRKMLGARGLHLLMTALGVVHESLAILCMPACRRVESSIASEIHL